MKQILTTQTFKRSLLVTAVLSALSSSVIHAQENEVAKEDDVERIMVTASKRLTGLQETPIAITVVRGDVIEKANVLDINDLQTLVPTLRVTPLQR